MDGGKLVLVRHGESRLNKHDVFTGWLDPSLSELGIKEAENVAEHCLDFDYEVAFTSNLERAHETLSIILSKQSKIGLFQHDKNSQYEVSSLIMEKMKNEILPIYPVEELNERYYGQLQGLNKTEVVAEYGDEIVLQWRRSYAERPPGGESLEDVYLRVVPFFNVTIFPLLIEGMQVLVVGHGNTLRALMKHIENITDDDIAFVDLPFAHPLVYDYKHSGLVRIEGEYTMNRPLR